LTEGGGIGYIRNGRFVVCRTGKGVNTPADAGAGECWVYHFLAGVVVFPRENEVFLHNRRLSLGRRNTPVDGRFM
jgi:hypothetical protein